MAWDNTTNYPGIRCFETELACSVPMAQSNGFYGLCMRPHFFGLTSTEDQPTLWNILESTLGAPMEFDTSIIDDDGWFGGNWPLHPGIYYKAERVDTPLGTQVTHELAFRMICTPDMPLPTLATWVGGKATTTMKPQDPITFAALDMGSQPICTLGDWPVPPFTLTPRLCCGGVIDND